MTSHAKILRASAGLMMLGSICPWATLLGLASVSGLAVHFGWITLLAGAGILWVTFRGQLLQRRRAIALGLACLAGLMCVLVIIGASHSADGAALQASWGVYLTLAASVTAAWTSARAPS